MSKFRIQNSEFRIEDLVQLLLENRGLKTKKEIEAFLHPRLEDVTISSVDINKLQLAKAVKRIQKAIKNKEQIVVFGDYDVDGICGSAVLWETLRDAGAIAVPYIPHRIDEGYGLSEAGIKNLKFKIKNCHLIITVDNGIVAHDAVEFANEAGIDVIITDHHVPAKTLPKAYAIVHTTKLCGAGVGWMLAQELKVKSEKFKVAREENQLELVALATIADLVPLTGANRTLTKFGLENLKKTKRVGLLELFKEAVINPNSVDAYTVGHIIAPRLNAMGRLEYAMDSLRLICTTNKERAANLAQLLGKTNRERQQLTLESAAHAIAKVKSEKLKVKSLLFVYHEIYQPGVIGLVAGRLVEQFYRPAIVLSIGEKHSKASARSIAGFNIIEFIRGSSHLLVDVGGHPMAAGFTVETGKISELEAALHKSFVKVFDQELLTRSIKIDCELPLEFVSNEVYQHIQTLAPFGMGNPTPMFVSKNVIAEDVRLIGKDQRHLKLKFKIQNSKFKIDGVAFGMGERIKEFNSGKGVDVVYTIDENIWNGRKSLQLKIRDVKVAD